MKRMTIGGILAGLALLLALLSGMVGTATLESTQGFSFLIFIGLIIYFWGRGVRKKKSGGDLNG